MFNVEYYRVIGPLHGSVVDLHATEEYLLEQVALGAASPTVLLFHPTKPGISISLGQSLEKDVATAACERDHVVVTRRKTGGRSVYLDDSHVTLSVIVPTSTYGGNRNTQEAYAHFCSQVSTTLQQIIHQNIIVANTNDFLLEDGRKIGGAAQWQKDKAVLLHAYFRHTPEWDRALQYLQIDSHPLLPYRTHFAGFTASVSEFLDASRDSFGQAFLQRFLSDVASLDTPLRDHELMACDHHRTTYTDSNWVATAYSETEKQSRGTCDLIAGTTLKIKELEGIVTYR